MNLKKTLSAIISVISAEADKNEAFKASLEQTLGIASKATGGRQAAAITGTTRKGGRRTPAVFDPVELARQGEGVLRVRIGTLNLEQLRDIVAQYGMDPGKLVMKWKDTKRLMDG